MAALELDYDELWGDGSAGRVAVGGVDVVVAGALGDAGFTEFGNEVWPGGKVLGEWLAARPELVRGKAVLELGAGAGLPGLVAAAAGAASTTLTDLPEALPLLTPAPKGMGGAVKKAEMLVAELGDQGKMLQQFDNPDNPKIHRETTGPEIWADTDGGIDILVGGVGTGRIVAPAKMKPKVWIG